MWMQTAALLLDAYRELQARKLFWATLILSAVVAGAIGFLGINDQGISVFGHTIRGPWNSNLIPPATFYQYAFSSYAIPGWLGFLAMILALIAVGGTFPDLLVGGSIELYLSKPIGRLRLFLTKYLFALGFTAAQVLVFCAVSYFVIGIRGGAWEPKVFLAVPIVTLLFSYLYSLCVLGGVLLRSTLTALLLTLLIWALIYLLSISDFILTRVCAGADLRVTISRNLVAEDQKLFDANAVKPASQQSNLTPMQFQFDLTKKTLADDLAAAAELHWWQRTIWLIEAPLPKIAETTGLMTRWLVTPQPILVAQSRVRQLRMTGQQRNFARTRDEQSLASFSESDEAYAARSQELRGRTLAWILGTSLGFEALVLALAAWLFCRRDY